VNQITTENIANFSKALNMAFDLLDNARINISRTENTSLLCQCHYLSSDNQTAAQREASCPSDFNCLFKITFIKTKRHMFSLISSNKL